MKTKIIFIPIICLSLFFTACLDDLNVMPLDDNNVTVDEAYSQEGAYLKGLMKIYSVLAMSGQDGEGSTDITGMDGGNTQLLRSLWILQEVSTDECINAWSDDAWTHEINGMNWTNTKCEPIEGVYQRCMFIVALVNEYLTQTTEEKVRGLGWDNATVSMVNGFRLEARYIRALAYYILMDTFGRPPFITEENPSLAPAQLERKELFNWIEGELNELKESLPNPRSSYGRVDKAAVNALLSRMYLNAQVYTGEERYTDCITASNAVINAGYTLADTYANLFRADNNLTCANEIILPICFDGAATKSWGGMTFLICASRGADEVSLEDDGVQAGWDGNRARPELVNKFSFSNPNYAADQDAASILDKRGIFYADGREIFVENWQKTFTTQGWAVYKYSNLNSDGSQGTDVQWPDTDFPFFRLGEIYLNYAEAVVRGGQGGTIDQAVTYVNELRARGYSGTSGDIQASDLTPNFLLDERVRELYWEGVRRTDLIRYGLYTSNNYIWNFKGGVPAGTSVPAYKDLFPIPLSDLSSNSSLTQNTGY